MQTPTITTRVSKCLDLAAYAARMLSKFSGNATLLGLKLKLEASADELEGAQNAYEGAVKAILPTRVDVTYEDHTSDRRIRLMQQKVEIADGRRGGTIAALVLPTGSTPITRLRGTSQVDAMIDLEGRLAASASFFPDALLEKAAIEEHRLRYQVALAGRDAAGQRARDLRARRNAIKTQFVLDYTEIAALVKAEFPRDRNMQDLFFDNVRGKSARAQADEDGGDSGDSGDNSGQEATQPDTPASDVDMSSRVAQAK